MSFTTLLFVMAASLLNPLLKFNFDSSGNAVNSWTIQNDNVMGGVSEGAVQWQEDGFRWYGHTRLENNGGFSSIRSPWKAFNLTEFDAIDPDTVLGELQANLSILCQRSGTCLPRIQCRNAVLSLCSKERQNGHFHEPP